MSLLASLLFAFAPYMVFMSGSQMNHVPTLLGTCAASLALERATAPGASVRHRSLCALACGLALGFAATVRPVDAVAFAAPVALWLAWRAMHDRTQEDLAAAAGVTRNFVSAIERGAQGLDAVRLRKLAAEMGMSVADLLAEPTGESR